MAGGPEWVYFTPAVSIMNTEGVRATLPVIGTPYQGGAITLNWLLGRGRPLIVDGPKILPGWLGPYDFDYYYRPDDLHPGRTLFITMSAIDAGNQSRAIAGVFNGTEPFAVGGFPMHFVHFEEVTPTSSEERFSFTLNAFVSDPSLDGGETRPIYLLIHGIHLFEGPQIQINDSGVDLFSFGPKAPIYEGNADDQSIATLDLKAAVYRSSYARRGTLFSWWQPLAATLTSSTSFAPLFPVTPALQTSLMTNGQTTKQVKARVFCGGNGQVRITMSNGSTTTFTHTGGTPEWMASQAFNVKTDDPTRFLIDGGLRGGTRDLMTVDYRATSGQFILNGLDVWEEAG